MTHLVEAAGESACATKATAGLLAVGQTVSSAVPAYRRFQ